MSPLCEGCLGAGIQRPATAVPGICPASSGVSSGGFSGDSDQLSFLSQVGASHLRVEPPCFKFDAETIDRMSAVGRLDFYMDTAKAAWASYYAVLQSVSRASSTVASSAASVASSYASASVQASVSSPSDVKSVPSKKKRDKLFQMVGKRRNVVASSKSIEDGYCYLHAIREEARDRVSTMLGPWPTVSRLVNQVSVADVLPVDQLRHVGVSYVDARVHVTPNASTCNFFSLLATIRGLADSSFGLLKLADGCVAYDPVHLACNVGGATPDWLSFAQRSDVSVIEVEMSDVQHCSAQGFQLQDSAKVRSDSYFLLVHGQSLMVDNVLVESRDVDVLVHFIGDGIVAGISQSEILTLNGDLLDKFEDEIYSQSLRPLIVDTSSVKVMKAGINTGLSICPRVSTAVRSGFDIACEVGFSKKLSFEYTDQFSLLSGPRLFPLIFTECLTLLPGLSCSVAFAPGAGNGFSMHMLREVMQFESVEQDSGYEY